MGLHEIMRPEIYQNSEEKWFNKNLPMPDQSRLVAGIFDLDIGKLTSLNEKLKSSDLIVWNIPEGAYSTIYFWSPVDKDLSTRIRARWYRKPIELENLNSNRIFVNPNQLASLEIKVTFPTENGKEYETKYRQKAYLSTIMDVSKNLQIATDILNSVEIPQEIFTAIGKEHPMGLVPTVMVSACRDHFVVDDSRPDDFRVTIDYNYKYHSFWSTPLWEAQGLSGYPNLRIEIKVGDNEWLEKAEEVIDIIKQEGGFVPKVTKHADKTFIDHKYSTI